MLRLRLNFSLKPQKNRWKRTVLACLLLGQLSPSISYALAPYSTQELDELEKEFMTLINQSDEIERNPLATLYINHLGKQLSQFAEIRDPYLFIVKSHEINAFAGPGGYIGVNSELILRSDNESELAAVLAHEIAHVRLHHLYNSLAHQKQMRIPMLAMLLASAALGIVNPAIGNAAIMASLTNLAQDNINFTRANEREADRIGIGMLIKAGFDPRGMSSFFKKMQDQTRFYYTANIPAILRSHPLDEERIAEAQNRYANLPKKIIADNIDYHLFKELIRVNVATNTAQLSHIYQNNCPASNKNFCNYGMALIYLKNNQFQLAKEKLLPLLSEAPINLYYELSYAQALIGLKDYATTAARLQDLDKKIPGNYAILTTYGEALLAAKKATKAVFIFLRASRLYPHDLILCNTLSRAEAEAKQIPYAYFTRAQCLLLEGKHKAAMNQLKLARKLAVGDEYLLARIVAKIEELEDGSDRRKTRH